MINLFFIYKFCIFLICVSYGIGLGVCPICRFCSAEMQMQNLVYFAPYLYLFCVVSSSQVFCQDYRPTLQITEHWNWKTMPIPFPPLHFPLPLLPVFPSLVPSSSQPSPSPCREAATKSNKGVWGSAVSSPSGVWGGAPAEIEFRAF